MDTEITTAVEDNHVVVRQMKKEEAVATAAYDNVPTEVVVESAEVLEVTNKKTQSGGRPPSPSGQAVRGFVDGGGDIFRQCRRNYKENLGRKS